MQRQLLIHLPRVLVDEVQKFVLHAECVLCHVPLQHSLLFHVAESVTCIRCCFELCHDPIQKSCFVCEGSGEPYLLFLISTGIRATIVVLCQEHVNPEWKSGEDPAWSLDIFCDTLNCHRFAICYDYDEITMREGPFYCSYHSPYPGFSMENHRTIPTDVQTKWNQWKQATFMSD